MPPGQRSPAPVALIAALLLSVIFVAPFAVWGNPYPPETIQYWLGGGVIVLLAAAAAFLLPADRAIRAMAAALRRPSPALFAAAVAATTLLLSAFFAVYAFRRSAMTSDEIGQLWHARMLLLGRLSLPVDPNREFFSLDTVVDSGRWYSQFPIGGPLVLAAGALFGTPWLVNPVLAGAAAALVYHFARRAFGETQGRAIAALFALTPMVLLMAGTWMNHVPVLFFAALALAALAEWQGSTSPRRSVLSAAVIGVALGAIVMIRPLDAIVVAGVIGVFQLWVVRTAPRRIMELIVEGACGALCVAVLLYANARTTGHALTFGYDVAWGPGHRVGFHVDPYGEAHTVARGLDYAVSYIGELNVQLLAWPIPAVLIMIAGLLATRPATRWDALVLALFGAQVAAYAAYWYRGELLGPRFLYTAIPSLVVLVARAPFLLARFGPRLRNAATIGVLACLAVAWCIPMTLNGVWGMTSQIRTNRRSLRQDVGAAVREANVHQALVFLHEQLGSQLARRLWALGVMHSDAAQLIATRDACALLSAIRVAEADTAAPARERLAPIAAAARFQPGPRTVATPDRTVHVSSPSSLTPECAAALDADATRVTTPFGPALVLEPIDAQGRIDGDVVYVADLGDRNAVLAERFRNRRWYRVAVRNDGVESRTVLVPY